jgi:hypothetical protein
MPIAQGKLAARTTDNLPRDRQPQSSARRGLAARWIDPEKWLEHAVEQIFRDTWTTIVDFRFELTRDFH